MLKLTLVTPNRKILTDAEVDEVFVPAFRGELNILLGHAALVTSLEPGLLKYRLKNSNRLEVAAISWGYCEVFNDVVNVLADTAELPGDLGLEDVKSELREIEEQLSGPDLPAEKMLELNRQWKRSQTRLQLLDDNQHH